jgi:hypothetical protein
MRSFLGRVGDPLSREAGEGRGGGLPSSYGQVANALVSSTVANVLFSGLP